MPEISVIVPVYNAEKYLDDCISSIINQTFRDFELILLPGNSDDSSTSVCEKWATRDNRIRIIDQDINSVSYARNKGISFSKGRYICFCDADDLYVENYLEKMHDVALADNSDIVECCFYQASEDLELKQEYENFHLISLFGHEIYERFGAVSIWKCMYKKSLWTENNVSFPMRQHGEDMAVYSLLFSLSKKNSFIDEPLYIYRDTPNSLTKNRDKDLSKIIASLEDLYTYIISEFERVGTYKENKSLIAAQLSHHSINAFSSFNDSSYEIKKDAATRLSQLIKDLTHTSSTVFETFPFGWGSNTTGFLCQLLAQSPDASNSYIKDMPTAALADNSLLQQLEQLYQKASPNILLIDFLSEPSFMDKSSIEGSFTGFKEGFSRLMQFVSGDARAPQVLLFELYPACNDNSMELKKEYLKLLYSYVKIAYTEIRIISAPETSLEKATQKQKNIYLLEQVLDIIYS